VFTGVPAKEVLCDFVQLVPQPPATEVNLWRRGKWLELGLRLADLPLSRPSIPLGSVNQ